MNLPYSVDYLLAEELARKAHCGQSYHTGAGPHDYYQTHLIGVARNFQDETLKIVAILHDILEDTDVTYETLVNLFGKNIANTVYALTKQRDEKYFDYIERVKFDGNARLVKIADVEFNLEQSRKKGYENLVQRYEKALGILGEKK